jgi:hypothetical protein
LTTGETTLERLTIMAISNEAIRATTPRVVVDHDPAERRRRHEAVRQALDHWMADESGYDYVVQVAAEAVRGSLDHWMADESGYDEEVGPELLAALERTRLAFRDRFDE